MRVSFCHYCKDRSYFPNLLMSRGLARHGVEVGVWAGEYSQILLRHWYGQLYLVDPWEHLDNYNDPRQDWDVKWAFGQLKELLQPYRRRYHIIKMMSLEATKVVPSNLDFAYIDANHNYEFVRDDLHAWYPKIRKNGYLAGHDWSPRFPGVEKAVREFAIEERKDICLIPVHSKSGGIDGGEQSWYMVR